MANSSEEMLSEDGFVDSLTEEQAEKLYTELKKYLNWY